MKIENVPVYIKLSILPAAQQFIGISIIFINALQYLIQRIKLSNKTKKIIIKQLNTEKSINKNYNESKPLKREIQAYDVAKKLIDQFGPYSSEQIEKVTTTLNNILEELKTGIDNQDDYKGSDDDNLEEDQIEIIKKRALELYKNGIDEKKYDDANSEFESKINAIVGLLTQLSIDKDAISTAQCKLQDRIQNILLGAKFFCPFYGSYYAGKLWYKASKINTQA